MLRGASRVHSWHILIWTYSIVLDLSFNSHFLLMHRPSNSFLAFDDISAYCVITCYLSEYCSSHIIKYLFLLVDRKVNVHPLMFFIPLCTLELISNTKSA